MPLPIRLKLLVPFTDEILDEIRYELEERGTVCEYPKCTSQAVLPYRNSHSLLFVCEEHDRLTKTAAKDPKSKFAMDRFLSEAMYEGMLSKSYVHLNNKSGFVLEEMVEAFEAEAATAVAKQAVHASKQQRELRKAFNESKIRVGAPDDDLMTGRQRNDLRERMGKPRIGSPTVQRTLPTVHTADLITTPTPDFIIPAPLPFPDFDFL